MTDDREFWHATTDWLEAGSDRTPPPAIDAVLLAVRTTRQERVLPGPWRSMDMTLIGRAIVAAAAVVAIAFAWINFGPSNQGTVGGIPTPTPGPTPTPIPIPTGSSTPGSPLRAGARYTTADPFPVAVSFVAPAGWVGNIGGQYSVFAGHAASGDDLRIQMFNKVYSDPCHPEKGTVVVGTTAQNLVDAIIGRPGLGPTDMTSTSLGGQPATKFALGLGRPLAGCTDGTYRIWELPLGATNELTSRMNEDVWVVATHTGPLVVTAVYFNDGTTAPDPRIQDALDSMQITP
jgi:hypothetical protein